MMAWKMEGKSKPLRGSAQKKSCKTAKENMYVFSEKINSKYSSTKDGSSYMNHNSFYCFSLKTHEQNAGKAFLTSCSILKFRLLVCLVCFRLVGS